MGAADHVQGAIPHALVLANYAGVVVPEEPERPVLLIPVKYGGQSQSRWVEAHHVVSAPPTLRTHVVPRVTR